MIFMTEAAVATTRWNLTPEEAKSVGLRAVNLMKAFNLRIGITRNLALKSLGLELHHSRHMVSC